MAATKLDCRFLNRKQRDTNQEHMYETKVCTTKMNGMMARSVSFSAVSWDASFVKTTAISYCHYRQKEEGIHTQTWCEQRDVQVGDELLRLRVEHALAGGDVPGEADADDLQHGLEDQQDEVHERRMAGMGGRAAAKDARHEASVVQRELPRLEPGGAVQAIGDAVRGGRGEDGHGGR